MQSNIQIQIPQQSLQISLSALSQVLDQAAPQDIAASPLLPAEIGADLQGGIYVGPMVEDGKLIHLISASESIGDYDWESAPDKAREYRAGGFDDWHLASKPEMLVALAHAQDKFEKVYHWTSTPYGSGLAWAVVFEDGDVNVDLRHYAFRVRPFRRFIS